MRFRCGLQVCLLIVALAIPEAASASDEFIAGYASSILENEFGVTNASLEVHDGIILLTTPSLGNVDQEKLLTALHKIPGVTQVEIRLADPSSMSRTDEAVQASIPAAHSKWLPRGTLFTPLHADPRWPNFDAAYRRFTKGLNLSNVFVGNFGETFTVYRDKAFLDGKWELGIQAGAFSIFDVSTSTTQLVNADYRVGVVGNYRNGRFSAFTRFYHQSSHLGDAFLNSPGVTNVKLSYEEMDLKLSYDLYSWLRIYGGAGIIVHRQPDNLGRGTTQWGVELVSARTFLSGRVRPVAYADFKCLEMTNWGVGQSLMAGVRFENALIGDRQMQLLAEFYDGPSPDGQFYTQRVSWYGVGLHFYF